MSNIFKKMVCSFLAMLIFFCNCDITSAFAESSNNISPTDESDYFPDTGNYEEQMLESIKDEPGFYEPTPTKKNDFWTLYKFFTL